jgi:hypothetical protein
MLGHYGRYSTKSTELCLGYMTAAFINLSLLLYVKMADQPCACRSCMLLNIPLAACVTSVHDKSSR